MKQHLNYIVFACLMGVLINSCKRGDLMDTKPTADIPDMNVYTSKEQILNQLRSLYTSFKNGQFYGGRYLIYSDIRSEEFLNERTNGVTGLQTWNHTLTNTVAEVNGLWAQAYLAINNCNIFLEGMDAQGNAVVGDSVSKNYLAEARFIRGLSYYSLLQLYARPYWDGNGSKDGLPIRLTGNKLRAEYQLARSTVAQVYTQILNDFNYAEANLPLVYGTSELNTTRAHRNTVIALKTRMYLSMQKYPEVIAEANKIVTAAAPFSAKTGVANALQSDVTKVFSTYNTTESIFSMPMTSTTGDFPGTQNQLAYYYSPVSSSGGVGNAEYSLNPSGIAGNTTVWSATDTRRAFVKTTGSGTSKKQWLVKYAAPTPYTDYVPVIRYAEVLLNLAEARQRNSTTVDAQAVALLNAVHNRSDAAKTYTVADFASPSDLINVLLTERRIEFLGEGLRSSDLLRLGLTIPAKVSTSATVPAIDANNRQYIWPISSTELDLNKLCKDNQ
ncbi:MULTISPECIES: RagB/SusD family nutrient uptake outer membrane protein [Niastella]|uniref:RagB/SusD family nutrient uptake outer membrane protein n=1 Tax=Niastella soli TaxID=2821487 RepID=A0ABS3YMS9_9BACT|nr:RagB/SusD family nutrient uptake outer membrane protein [Niastella soli]MBO9199188.1 RagB/SusD family nutrient uptake outer membrane protein [Niastella soli]